MVWMFVGEDIRYHYEVDGEERVTSMFEMVVRDAVENPETFGISMYLSDCSEQEWSLLVQLCEKLIVCRKRERYTGVKIEHWIKA